VIRTLASTENPLFSQASMSAAAVASSRRVSLNHRITRRRTRSVIVEATVNAVDLARQIGFSLLQFFCNAINPVFDAIKSTFETVEPAGDALLHSQHVFEHCLKVNIVSHWVDGTLGNPLRATEYGRSAVSVAKAPGNSVPSKGG
jgi:hypothetical protein